jgi:hypothetical protein
VKEKVRKPIEKVRAHDQHKVELVNHLCWLLCALFMTGFACAWDVQAMMIFLAGSGCDTARAFSQFLFEV